MTSCRVLDKDGRELHEGDQVRMSGFDPPEQRPGTINRLLDDQYGRYAAVEFPEYETLSDFANADGRCTDLELITDQEKERSDG